MRSPIIYIAAIGWIAAAVNFALWFNVTKSRIDVRFVEVPELSVPEQRPPLAMELTDFRSGRTIYFAIDEQRLSGLVDVGRLEWLGTAGASRPWMVTAPEDSEFEWGEADYYADASDKRWRHYRDHGWMIRD